MKESNPVRDKSFDLALASIELYKYLKTQNEFVLAKQLLKSGTSVGANVEEAIGGQSRKDFLMKLTIAYKEARETNYWLRLIKASVHTDEQLLNKAMQLSQEVLRLIGSIQKTLKNT